MHKIDQLETGAAISALTFAELTDRLHHNMEVLNSPEVRTCLEDGPSNPEYAYVHRQFQWYVDGFQAYLDEAQKNVQRFEQYVADEATKPDPNPDFERALNSAKAFQALAIQQSAELGTYSAQVKGKELERKQAEKQKAQQKAQQEALAQKPPTPQKPVQKVTPPQKLPQSPPQILRGGAARAFLENLPNNQQPRVEPRKVGKLHFEPKKVEQPQVTPRKAEKPQVEPRKVEKPQVEPTHIIDKLNLDVSDIALSTPAELSSRMEQNMQILSSPAVQQCLLDGPSHPDYAHVQEKFQQYVDQLPAYEQEAEKHIRASESQLDVLQSDNNVAPEERARNEEMAKEVNQHLDSAEELRTMVKQQFTETRKTLAQAHNKELESKQEVKQKTPKPPLPQKPILPPKPPTVKTPAKPTQQKPQTGKGYQEFKEIATKEAKDAGTTIHGGPKSNAKDKPMSLADRFLENAKNNKAPEVAKQQQKPGKLNAENWTKRLEEQKNNNKGQGSGINF